MVTKRKTTRLTVWDLAVIEGALRSYDAPGFDDHAKSHYQELIELISAANGGSLKTPETT